MNISAPFSRNSLRKKFISSMFNSCLSLEVENFTMVCTMISILLFTLGLKHSLKMPCNKEFLFEDFKPIWISLGNKKAVKKMAKFGLTKFKPRLSQYCVIWFWIRASLSEAFLSLLLKLVCFWSASIKYFFAPLRIFLYLTSFRCR